MPANQNPEPSVTLSYDGVAMNAHGHSRTITRTDFDTAIKNFAAPLSSGLLPPAVRWISATGRAVILERPPFAPRVGYRPARAGHVEADRAIEYHLPVPWQVYGLVFSSDFTRVIEMTLFLRNTPIVTMDDPLFMFFYPNSFNDGRICLGPGFYNHFTGGNLGPALMQATNALWTADFNEDAGEDSWTAEWRCPMDYLPGHLRRGIRNGDVRGTDLLDYYASIPLNDMLGWALPPANTMTGAGEIDTVAHLIRRMERIDSGQPHPLNGGDSVMTWLTQMINGARIF